VGEYEGDNNMNDGNNRSSDSSDYNYIIETAAYLERKIKLLTRLQNIADMPTLLRRDCILKLLVDLKAGEITPQ
jgi:hypothetical protein